MKTKIQIKTYWGSVLFEYEKKENTIKDTLEQAIKTGAYLRGAYLTGADLRGADLRGANLRGADLTDAYLTGADLRGADLRGADLRDANLRGADLRGAYLRGADLTGADLRGADLRGANLRGADLKKIQPYFQIIPEGGAFIAWKKGHNDDGGCLIKLEIPAKAKRHNSLGGRKCRAEFARVLDIRNSKGNKIKECGGTHNNRFIYRVGETVIPDKYDPNPLVECSNGIHFFISQQEAKDWQVN